MSRSLSLCFKTAQVALLAVAVCFSLGATNASERYDHMNHQLMCTCGCGQILGECNHVGCPDSPGELDVLRADIASGQSDDQIRSSFAAKYGAIVLAAPTFEGFNLVAWIAPFAVFAAATIGTILLVRRWSAGSQPSSPAGSATAASTDPAELERRERIRRETGDGGY